MCTNIGATGSSVGRTGKTYIGSVSDDPYDIRTKVVVRRNPTELGYIGTHLSPLNESIPIKRKFGLFSSLPLRSILRLRKCLDL